MRDIDRQIKRWRRKLAFRGGFSKSDLDELESHLRQEIDRLTESGMSTSQACKTAIQQLGGRQMLAAEYHKVNFFSMWGKRLAIGLSLLLPLMIFLPQYAGEIELETVTGFDEIGSISPTTNYFIEFREKPLRPLKLPDIGSETARFFDIWIGDNVHPGLLLLRADHDLIYIDLNGDRDLTNDGPPKVFSLSANELTVRFPRGTDPNAFVELALLRKPYTKDPQKLARIFDENGNLTKSFIRFVKMYPEYNGGKRSYYFGDLKNLRRGTAEFNGKTYPIALLDFNFNGVYNDADADYLLIDINRDDKLHYLFEEEVFKLTEVFRVDGSNYRISHIDDAGKHLKIEPTDAPETFDHIKAMEKIYAETARFIGVPYSEPKNFWESELITLDNRVILPENYRGKYLLITFRGADFFQHNGYDDFLILKRVRGEYSNDQLAMLTFLYYDDQTDFSAIDLAEVPWPVVLFTKKHRASFDFSYGKFMTNIFIDPAGNATVTSRRLNRLFFRQRITKIQQPAENR